MLLHTYQVFSSLVGDLHFFVHFFLQFYGVFFFWTFDILDVFYYLNKQIMIRVLLGFSEMLPYATPTAYAYGFTLSAVLLILNYNEKY